MIRTRLGMIATFLVVGVAASACMGFGSDTPAQPQQQGPVVVPVINQSSDNSGWFVLIAVIIIGLGAAVVAMFRHAQREADRRRDAEAMTTRILDALPDDVHREISYMVGYQPGGQVHRAASIGVSSRRAISDGR